MTWKLLFKPPLGPKLLNSEELLVEGSFDLVSLLTLYHVGIMLATSPIAPMAT